jgi:hypothetical protein
VGSVLDFHNSARRFDTPARECENLAVDATTPARGEPALVWLYLAGKM